ncbi:MAG: CDP-glycerol glycerophosphotransferase family protein [Candidatus Aenigmarchaeota archaeon]|nr:CDP-glycerol glycerophosphotransferase family protein [Candidatus Aenigmarchaeota archaeon]
MKTIVLMDLPYDIKVDGLIIPLSGAAEKMLLDKKISCMPPDRYKSSINIDHKLVNDIRKIWSAEAGRNKFKETFFDKNYHVSLTRIAEDWLLGTTPYCESIINALDFIDLLNAVIKKEVPDKIVLISRDWEKIAICKQLKNCEILDVGIDKEKRIRKLIKHKLVLYRSLARRIRHKKNAKPDEKKTILSFAAKRLRVIDSKTRNVSDVMFDYFRDKDNYRLIIADFSAKSHEGRDVSYVPIEWYLRFGDMRFAKNAANDMKKLWEKSKKSSRTVLAFRGFDIWGIVVPRLDFFFSHFLERVFMEMRMFENAILEERPALIINDDAPNIRGMEIAAVARKRGVRSLALQHGGMIGNWITNILSKNEADQKNAYSCPLPDFITSHGMSDKRFMVRTTKINSNVIFNVGDPQYDFLLRAALDEGGIRSEFKLARTKTILFAPSTDNPSHEKSRIADMVFSAANGLDAQLVVKLHPREREAALYAELSKKTGNAIFIDQRRRDTHKLIAISDIVISNYSSVNLEAVLLKKPSIMVDPFGKYKNINYYGAILNVSSEQKLAKVLKRILDGKLEMPRKKFIENFYFKTDGMACKRIADVVYRLVKK